jgi:hypothetical protein
VSGAFYTTVSWLAKDLRTYGYPLIMTQGILITSLVPNALGLLLVGMALDRGAPALWLNVLLVLIGSALGFCIYWGVSQSLATAWGLVSLFHLVIGGAMANVALPCTRIYEPLSRTTGFSFGYNCGYGARRGRGRERGRERSCAASDTLPGPTASAPRLTDPIPMTPPARFACRAGVIGGLSPLAVAAIKANLGGVNHAFSPAIWLVCLGGISLFGSVGLRMYDPRLNRPFVGRIE